MPAPVVLFSLEVTPMNRSAFSLLLVASLAAAACNEDIPVTAPVGFTDLVPKNGVAAAIIQTPGPQVGTVRLTVRVLSSDVELGSYQGAVTFAPGSFELVSISTPEGIEGEMHIVNDTEIGAGRIRFAAYATEKFSEETAFSFIVRPTAGTAAMKMAATLDVAGQTSGVALTEPQLRATTGVRDGAGRLLDKN